MKNGVTWIFTVVLWAAQDRELWTTIIVRVAMGHQRALAHTLPETVIFSNTLQM